MASPPGTLPEELRLATHAHVKYIQSLDTRKEDYDYWLTEHLRLNGVYWGLGLDVPSKADVRVVDTIGAGDSFMAGLISGLLDAGLLGDTDARQRLSTATIEAVAGSVSRAMATSAITVGHAGAYAPTREEI
jgi:sugar/nucleoside kinase (ribokinase family)